MNNTNTTTIILKELVNRLAILQKTSNIQFGIDVPFLNGILAMLKFDFNLIDGILRKVFDRDRRETEASKRLIINFTNMPVVELIKKQFKEKS